MATLMELIVAAKAGIENLTPDELRAELTRPGVLLVDVREPDETRSGVIPGALLVPRGTLELCADPATASHLAPFDPARRVVLYCAAGSRSALAARALQELGYRDVAHLEGGFRAWSQAGLPTRDPGDDLLAWRAR